VFPAINKEAIHLHICSILVKLLIALQEEFSLCFRCFEGVVGGRKAVEVLSVHPVSAVQPEHEELDFLWHLLFIWFIPLRYSCKGI
jgi:hypothetical protein